MNPVQMTDLMKSDKKILDAILEFAGTSENDPCQSDLKRLAGLSYATVRISLERLRAMDLIEMKTVRRAKEVRLTEKGSKYMLAKVKRGPIDRFVVKVGEK